MKNNSLGVHWIAEFYECDQRILDNKEELEKIFLKAVEVSGATFIKKFFHQFAPQGVSGAVIIAESHFTVHTWPEYGYAAVDIFTCGEKIDSEAAVKFIEEELKAKRSETKRLGRGVLNIPNLRHKTE